MLALAMAMAGCGGGGGNDGGTTASANQAESQATSEAGSGEAGAGNSGEASAGAGSKAAFIAEADAICKKAQARTTQEFGEYSEGKKGSGSGSKLVAQITTQVIVPRLEDRIEGIRALNAPPSAEEAVNTLIESFEQLRKAAEADPVGFESTAAAVLPKVRAAVHQQGFTGLNGCAGYLG